MLSKFRIGLYRALLVIVSWGSGLPDHHVIYLSHLDKNLVETVLSK